MHRSIKCLTRNTWYLIVLAFSGSVMCAEPIVSPDFDPTLPPVVYTLTVKSEAVDSWSLGIVTGLIGEAYRKSHERFLAAIKVATAGDGPSGGFLRHFACIGISDPAARCRQIIQRQSASSLGEMSEILRTQSIHTALVADITIIFDGRFFQVPTLLHEERLTDDGKVVVTHDRRVTYINAYSRKLHQADIDSHRNDSPFDGKLGSKAARMHFWLGGPLPRLISELDTSASLIAQLYSAVLSPEASGVLADDSAGRDSLPRVLDVIGKDKAKCRSLHDQLLVVREMGDYLWMAFPTKVKGMLSTVIVEPRCGFDY